MNIRFKKAGKARLYAGVALALLVTMRPPLLLAAYAQSDEQSYPSSGTTLQGSAQYYVDQNGNHVDENGNLVDQDGNPVDPDDHPVDTNGNPVDPNGDQTVTTPSQDPAPDDETAPDGPSDQSEDTAPAEDSGSSDSGDSD